ncbi:post-transcriptional regulator [Niallia circulans]|uniref:post-transcriptional regulator n=1 Tax=Niallia circulans TaxID=1397 RepID=UPI00201DED23|nr:post-transcriptional regulator [Niallia circulans]UQZ76627.1 post-transcriptional regulator [Niallia circulans]
MSSTSAHIYDQYRSQVKPVLNSKIEEFHLLGYETIKEDELWVFLTNKKWRKPAQDIRISELVQDILNVKVADYMNFATIEAYKTADLFSVLSEEEKKELLK